MRPLIRAGWPVVLGVVGLCSTITWAQPLEQNQECQVDPMILNDDGHSPSREQHVSTKQVPRLLHVASLAGVVAEEA